MTTLERLRETPTQPPSKAPVEAPPPWAGRVEYSRPSGQKTVDGVVSVYEIDRIWGVKVWSTAGFHVAAVPETANASTLDGALTVLEERRAANPADVIALVVAGDRVLESFLINKLAAHHGVLIAQVDSHAEVGAEELFTQYLNARNGGPGHLRAFVSAIRARQLA